MLAFKNGFCHFNGKIWYSHSLRNQKKNTSSLSQFFQRFWRKNVSGYSLTSPCRLFASAPTPHRVSPFSISSSSFFYACDRLTNVLTRAKIMITYLSRFGLSSELSSFINDGCKLNRRLKCFPIISICACAMRQFKCKCVYLYLYLYKCVDASSMLLWMLGLVNNAAVEWMAHAKPDKFLLLW